MTIASAIAQLGFGDNFILFVSVALWIGTPVIYLFYYLFTSAKDQKFPLTNI